MTGGYDIAGSAVAVWGQHVVLDNCVFRGNTAIDHGGSVGIFEGSATITNCRFEDSSANRGGALAAQISELAMSGCTFRGNSAISDGGAFYLASGFGDTISSCTFTDNTAPRGAHVTRVQSQRMSVFMKCIVAFGNGGEGYYWDGLGELQVSCTDIFGNEGGDWVGEIAGLADAPGNLAADPVFCGDNDPDEALTLAAHSPCAAASNPDCGLIGAHPVGCYSVAVGDQAIAPPAATLHPCFPNPFNPSTTIRYDLNRPARVSLRIFDTSGRCVCELKTGQVLPAGRHEVVWNGTDIAHRAVPAGVYLLQLQAGTQQLSQRVALIK